MSQVHDLCDENNLNQNGSHNDNTMTASGFSNGHAPAGRGGWGSQCQWGAGGVWARRRQRSVLHARFRSNSNKSSFVAFFCVCFDAPTTVYSKNSPVLYILAP